MNGHASTVLYSAFESSQNSKLVTLGSEFLFPGMTDLYALLCSQPVCMESGTSGAMTFTTLVLILFILPRISVALVFLGA